MVKFEDGADSFRYVDPARVREIKSAGPNASWVVFATNDGFVVSQSPDEVHAKLFPPAIVHDEGPEPEGIAAPPDRFIWNEVAALHVLEWAAGPNHDHDAARALARKALGREGT